jgi:hypothetical protein
MEDNVRKEKIYYLWPHPQWRQLWSRGNKVETKRRSSPLRCVLIWYSYLWKWQLLWLHTVREASLYSFRNPQMQRVLWKWGKVLTCGNNTNTSRIHWRWNQDQIKIRKMLPTLQFSVFFSYQLLYEHTEIKILTLRIQFCLLFCMHLKLSFSHCRRNMDSGFENVAEENIRP